MEEIVNQLNGIIPQKYLSLLTALFVGSQVLGRIAQSIRSGGGLRSIIRGIWFGTNTVTPKQAAPPEPSIADKITGWLLVGIMTLALSGCGTLYTNIVTMKKVGDSISAEYAQLYKAGLISPEQDAKAEAAHAEYREAMGVLATALEAAQLSGDASDVPGKLRAAKQAITPMLNLISPLLSNSKANTLQKQLTTASAQ
jgi:hypothetical protein